MSLQGQHVDRFEVGEELGRGGMGIVHRARDTALNRPVALKVLTEAGLSDAKARERFQKEIESAVSIEHPHVVPVYDAGYDGTNFYIAMRLVDGPDLASIIRDEGPLSERRALRLVAQVANALASMHARGMVHRDVKPHNVLVWEAGTAEEHSMLTDFGIAKALDETGTLTGLGPPGTPGYMPPELWSGRPASPASDQYSLACMAYELLSGELPFEVAAAKMADAHASEQARPLHELSTAISEDASHAVAQGLAKSPVDRHRDVRAMISAAGAGESFSESERIRRITNTADNTSERAAILISQVDVSDARAAAVTGMERSKVARLRRRLAREALIGTHHSRES